MYRNLLSKKLRIVILLQVSLPPKKVVPQSFFLFFRQLGEPSVEEILQYCSLQVRSLGGAQVKRIKLNKFEWNLISSPPLFRFLRFPPATSVSFLPPGT